MERKFDKIGERYSRLSDEKRKEKVKEVKSKLKSIKEKNKRIQEKITNLYNEKMNDKEYDLEQHLELLTHTYQVGEWVILKGQTSDETQFTFAKIKRKIANKRYEVYDYNCGLKGCFTMPKIHENQIVCKIGDVASFRDIKFYDTSYLGKVKHKKEVK